MGNLVMWKLSGAGPQARTARLRRSRSAERRAATRAGRTIERSERPALEGKK